MITIEFFGAVFGPWVGLFTAIGLLVGFLITSVSSSEFPYYFPTEEYWPLQVGLMLVGFICGFTMLKKKGRYTIGRTLGICSSGAVAGSVVAIFIYYVQYPLRQSVVNDVLEQYGFLALCFIIASLILLPFMVVVYKRIANRSTPRSSQGNRPPQALARRQNQAEIQRPRPQRALSVKLKILLIVQALLTIGGGGIFFYQAMHSSATDFQDIYLKATSGTPAIDDPLSRESIIDWNAIGACTFTGGALHAAKLPKEWGGFQSYCIAWSTSFKDFAFQVHMTIIKGEAGTILFRYSKLTNYVFAIGPDGSYRLDINHSVQGGTFNHNMTKEGYSAAFKTGPNQSNLLTVIAEGSHIYLYVNKQYVFSIIDDISPAGSIGVGGVDANMVAVDVAFSNAQVWTLP